MFYTKEPMLNKPDADLQKQRTKKRVEQAIALNAVIHSSSTQKHMLNLAAEFLTWARAIVWLA